jgi:1-acyl-sn-glycerol-3-phosphate acyltransferase
VNDIPWLGRVTWRPTGAAIRTVGRGLWRARYQYDAAIPDGPFVLAANHFSFLDPPLLAAAIPRPIRFLALDELLGNHRLLDLALDTWGVIHVSRASRSIAAVRSALAHLRDGGAVGLFPEGRRVASWGEVGFKRGAAWLAVRSGSPLLPAAVEGSDEVMGIDNRFRPGRLRVRIGEPMWADPVSPDPVAELLERWKAWVTEALA